MRINSSRSQIETRSFWLRRPKTEALVQLHSYLHTFYKAEQFAFSWKQYYFGSIYANIPEKWVDRQVELKKRWKNNIIEWENVADFEAILRILLQIFGKIYFFLFSFFYLFDAAETNKFCNFSRRIFGVSVTSSSFFSCDALTFSCWLWICCRHARAKMQFAL